MMDRLRCGALFAFVIFDSILGFNLDALFDLSRLHEPQNQGILYEVSSFDREGGNIRDGFMDAYAIRMEANEYVVMDEYGPGVLVNFWVAQDTTGLHTGDVRFLFDDDTVHRKHDS